MGGMSLQPPPSICGPGRIVVKLHPWQNGSQIRIRLVGFFLIQKIIKIPYILWVFLKLPEVFDYYRYHFASIFAFLPVSSQSGHGLEAKITDNVDGNKKYSDCSHISFTDLADFPPFSFLRFGSINTFISFPDASEDEKAWDTQSIDTKCQFFEDQLKFIKPALDDIILCYHGEVDDDKSSCFADHSELLNYFRNRLPPICGDNTRYAFVIALYSEKCVGRCIISSLLQMPQISCCSTTQIDIYEADQINACPRNFKLAPSKLRRPSR